MLRNREKAIVVLGGIAAAAILIASLVVIPGVSRARQLSRIASQAERDLAEVRRMRPELEAATRDVRQKMGKITGQANVKESPVARITALLTEAGYPQSAFSLKSGGRREGEFAREDAFDLKIENLTYLEAARIAAKLENGPLPVVIRSSQIKSRYDDSRYADATFRIGFLSPKGP